MSETLARVETKMDRLVGPDGNNGEWLEVKTKVEAHHAYILQQTGGASLLKIIGHAIWTLVAGCIGAIVTMVIKGK